MTTKNPFQIRAEVLELAKEYMDKQRDMNIAYAQKMIELNKIAIDEAIEMTKPYTFDQLMEKAKEMYNFVSKKD